jgi:hypothetical protein
VASTASLCSRWYDLSLNINSLEVGCGFFGMNHNAKDITNEIHKLYEDYDKYLISNLITTSVHQLENHINSTFFIVDSTVISKRPKISEEQV